MNKYQTPWHGLEDEHLGNWGQWEAIAKGQKDSLRLLRELCLDFRYTEIPQESTRAKGWQTNKLAGLFSITNRVDFLRLTGQFQRTGWGFTSSEHNLHSNAQAYRCNKCRFTEDFLTPYNELTKLKNGVMSWLLCWFGFRTKVIPDTSETKDGSIFQTRFGREQHDATERDGCGFDSKSRGFCVVHCVHDGVLTDHCVVLRVARCQDWRQENRRVPLCSRFHSCCFVPSRNHRRFHWQLIGL